MHYFKNGSQIEILSFLQLLIELLNYSILDHMYGMGFDNSVFFTKADIKIWTRAFKL